MKPTDLAGLIDSLLTPISGPDPAGQDLRYTPVYDKIRLARRAADDKLSGMAEIARRADPQKGEAG